MDNDFKDLISRLTTYEPDVVKANTERADALVAIEALNRRVAEMESENCRISGMLPDDMMGGAWPDLTVPERIEWLKLTVSAANLWREQNKGGLNHA